MNIGKIGAFAMLVGETVATFVPALAAPSFGVGMSAAWGYLVALVGLVATVITISVVLK